MFPEEKSDRSRNEDDGGRIPVYDDKADERRLINSGMTSPETVDPACP